MCSGKVFYDLVKKRNDEKRQDIGIVRIEQLYPFPYDDLEGMPKKYKNVDDMYGVKKEKNHRIRSLV